jgi:hypothetical protein
MAKTSRDRANLRPATVAVRAAVSARSGRGVKRRLRTPGARTADHEAPADHQVTTPNDAKRGRARLVQGVAAGTAIGRAGAEQTGENDLASRLA